MDWAPCFVGKTNLIDFEEAALEGLDTSLDFPNPSASSAFFFDVDDFYHLVKENN